MALLDALPELAGTLAEAYLRRTLERREGAVFEMPSPFRAEGWLQCRLAEVGDGIAILLRDITGEVRRLSIPDAQDEVLRAMAFNDAVAFVRLSLRAYIEEASAGFSALLGLSEDRLIGLHFCNLVDFKQREAVGDALEAVLGKGEGRTVAARLLNSRGELVAVTMGVAGTCGGYCRDGAGIVVSRCGGESVAPPVALLRQAR
jgi:PAS domain-containing protein